MADSDAGQPQGNKQEADPTIGGPTANAMGTEYEVVSDAGKHFFDQPPAPGTAGRNPEGRGDAGRDPEFDGEKRSPEGTLGDQDTGREQPQGDESDRPGTAAPRSATPD